MNKFLKKLKNNGIDLSTDLESFKRIRLCNNMSIAGISVGCIVLSYALLNKWSLNIILMISLLLAATIIPTVLNFYKKTSASRTSYITDAIKFQQANVASIIKITNKEKNKYWQFCVADNGIGINSKKEIFQMFAKLFVAEKYDRQGIDLAFCKKIVEIHKGKILVESSTGEGSRFYFTI